MASKKQLLLLLLFLVLLFRCEKAYETIKPSNAYLKNNNIYVTFSGRVYSFDEKLIELRRDCFTCTKVAFTAEECPSIDINTFACNSSSLPKVDALKITFPASSPSGTYYLVIAEGAVKGEVYTIYSLKEDTTIPDVPASLFKFEYRP
ncbi:MAG: hypothetical protein QXS54_13085 [Candidatus Methanomethylicaceae archaeon]